MIGRTIGPYEIVAKLGEGGMGEIYKARDTKLGRIVALKILPEAFALDPERLQRFDREARALAALNHPNIAQVFGFEQLDNVRAIAMEFVEGEDLTARIGRSDLSDTLSIAHQIAAALEAAHDQGIVHRDLKPANVRVREDGTVKVLDFGLAKATDPAGTSNTDSSASPTMTSPATGFGMILGTAAYMSPEQARGRAVDRRADIWAFGVVLFEMLTGRRLFDGETVTDMLAAVLRQDIPWERLPANTSPRLRRLLERCLERDPQRRLRDAGDAKFEIEDLLAKRPEPAETVTQISTSTALPRSRMMERVAWTVLALATAAVGWWFGRQRTETNEVAWSHFTQLTDEIGAEESPAISPDGTSIAYASRTAGSWDIYVRRIGGRNSTIVAGDPARQESAPAFSPDGRQVTFHEADTDGGIFVVGATGESVRRLTQSGFHPAWSPDGKEIAFCDERIVQPSARSTASALSVANVATGTVRQVFKADAVQPEWSPSGRRLVFWAQIRGRRDIFTIAADGGDPVPVTSDDALDWSATWSPDGRYVYFASDRGGAMNLWRIAVDETSGRALSAPEPVTSGVQAGADRPTFSKDGTKLVFRSTLSSVNPAAFPFDPVAERLGEPKHLFERTGVLAPDAVSPDGQWLSLSAVGTTAEDIFVSRTDGSDLRRLTDDPFLDRAPVWSPDSKRIVFYSNRSGTYQAWSIRPDGSALTQLTNREGVALWYPFFEPSGARLWVFDSAKRAPLTVDLTQPFPQTGIDMPIMEVEGGYLRGHAISPDGARMVGVAIGAGGSRLGVGWRDLKSGAVKVVATGPATGRPWWLPDSRRALVTDGDELVLIDVETGRQRRFKGPWPFSLYPVLTMTPDGKTIIVGAGNPQSDIWMLERQK